MYCPRKHSGSMPAEQAQPQRTRGGIVLRQTMPITTVVDTHRHAMWDYTVPTRGAFLICTAMCLSGRRTGGVLIQEAQLSIRGGQTKAPTVSFGAAPGPLPVRPCVRPSATTTPPVTATSPLASVSVSNSSKPLFERMKNRALRKEWSAAGLAKRGASPKGPCQQAQPRCKNS